MRRVRRDCRLAATAFVLAIAAAANICWAENSASTENSPNCDRSSAPCCDALLHRLLTWPEPQEKADDDNGGPPKEEPLESDRPDFTDSPKTVGRGRLQIAQYPLRSVEVLKAFVRAATSIGSPSSVAVP